jgi:hypothetical protein
MQRQPSGASPVHAQSPRRRRARREAWLPLLAALQVLAVPLGAQDRRQQSRLDEALRREGDAVIALADRAMSGNAPADFALAWRNDFFKAQPGTFVPFTLTADPGFRPSGGALIYVRVVERQAPANRRQTGPAYAYETIFAIDAVTAAEPLRVQRGFAVPPGRYTVYVVVRERPADLLARSTGKRRAAVLTQPLDVPDFWTGELAVSSVILATRVETLPAPLPPAELEENPYVIGNSRVYPAAGAVFRREGELVVVFLIYNPRVGRDKHFDVQVDYHLYRKNGDRERYVTRTNPQRFNPSLMGPYFDPSSGQPVLAGQGILLSEFETGEYRLGITVTDLQSQKTVSRDVAFTVMGS